MVQFRCYNTKIRMAELKQEALMDADELLTLGLGLQPP
ncbi:hypothetical protein DFAR_970010 [Desulfarculales bacterium]